MAGLSATTAVQVAEHLRVIASPPDDRNRVSATNPTIVHARSALAAKHDLQEQDHRDDLRGDRRGEGDSGQAVPAFARLRRKREARGHKSKMFSCPWPRLLSMKRSRGSKTSA